MSYLEHFINICGYHGMDKDALRAYLDYMIMCDFILSGRDRHLNNISILRDAKTLKIIKPAPIYDSGRCLFVQDSVPANDRELLSIKTDIFMNDEFKLLNLVTDKSLVDVTKLPERKWIEELYLIDSKMDERRMQLIKFSLEEENAAELY